jgi:hypothetical protein
MAKSTALRIPSERQCPSFFLFNTILAPLAEVEATEIATTVIHLGRMTLIASNR